MSTAKPWDRYLTKADKACMKKWGIEELSQHTHFVETADNWNIALSSYTSKEQVGKRYPVLLCHGLGSNRLAYNLDKEHSLALFLAAQGYDVYAVDLRGHGLSEKPNAGGSNKKWNWGFNEYAYEDLPCVINKVLELSGKEKLHFIGHSMGGILLYCLQAMNPHLPIQSGMTIGSTLNYHNSKTVFNLFVKFKPLTGLINKAPIHYTALLSSVLTQFSRAFIDSVYVCADNVETQSYRKLMENAMQATSAKVLSELALAINGEGMKNRDGVRYETLLKDAGYSFPILAIAGTRDTQCSSEAAARFGTHWQNFGKKYGHSCNYGHMDLLSGTHSPQEVWPEIERWLNQQDSR